MIGNSRITRSLQWRLLIHTSLATLIVLGLLGIGLYISIRQSLLNEFDKALRAKTRALQTMVEQSEHTVKFDFDPLQMPEFVARQNPEYFQAWFAGNVLGRSPSLAGGNLFSAPPQSDGLFNYTTLPDGRPGRVLTMAFSPSPESDDTHAARPSIGKVTISVATDTTSMDLSLARLRWLLLGLCGLAIVLSGALLMGIVRQEVAPLVNLAGEIERLNETDLSPRFRPTDVPTELAPVVEKLNGLLTRLNAAFTREKAFTADVAHELRTPLAGMLATLDVCRSRPRDAASYLSAIDKSHAMIQRMQSMIESLLLLARAESGQVALDTHSFDLALLMEECRTMFEPQALQRELKIQWEVPPACIINSDPDKLRIILQNLLDNAVSYANDRGDVRVKLSSGRNGTIVEVANTGSQLSATDATHLFERFWRGDQSRTGGGAHCGLGLSLSKRLADLLNAELKIDPNHDAWFIARIELPRSS